MKKLLIAVFFAAMLMPFVHGAPSMAEAVDYAVSKAEDAKNTSAADANVEKFIKTMLEGKTAQAVAFAIEQETKSPGFLTKDVSVDLKRINAMMTCDSGGCKYSLLFYATQARTVDKKNYMLTNEQIMELIMASSEPLPKKVVGMLIAASAESDKRLPLTLFLLAYPAADAKDKGDIEGALLAGHLRSGQGSGNNPPAPKTHNIIKHFLDITKRWHK